jgi:allantoate deiminase
MTASLSFTPSMVNQTRVQNELQTLSQFGQHPAGGISRFTFGEAHQSATFQTAGWMAEAGLEVFFDRWGNLYGRTPGFEAEDKVILTGSHLDSVPNGGDYDGPLGVISALEAVRLILENKIALSRPIEVISFIEEEGTTFHGLMGSQLATGGIDDDEVGKIADRDGNHFLEVLNGVEFPFPVDPRSHLRERVASYLELHIEQGRRLEDAGVPIGVVTGIAGPNFMRIQFTGRSDHAGATAYADRRDTLLAAAEVIVKVRELGVSRFTGKGHMTVGRINVRPNAINVVAGETDFAVDFRAADAQTAIAMREAVEKQLRDTCNRHPVNYEIAQLESVPPVQTPRHIQEAIERGVAQAGAGSMSMVSWAAHDAMVMAKVTDAGMIFVPSKDGRSHCPEEYTEPEDIAAGIATLANALVELAGH